MSASNGIIRIGRKGMRKFAFGEDGKPFEVDVVVAFQRWINIDDDFRSLTADRSIPVAEMPRYHVAAQEYIKDLSGEDVTVAEALDFIARLIEEHNGLAVFFRPKLQEERSSPGTLGAELRFSVEEPDQS